VDKFALAPVGAENFSRDFGLTTRKFGKIPSSAFGGLGQFRQSLFIELKFLTNGIHNV